jgi:hypothetical protein
MAFNLNPMGITSGVWAGNAQQADYRVPVVSSAVASYPIGTNMQGVTWPIPAYVQPNFAPRAPHPTAPLGDGAG